LKAVLKLGGFAFPPGLSAKDLGPYVKIIRNFSKRNALTVVTGGGPTARTYIAAARELGATEAVCDRIGIEVSRLNAKLLCSGLGSAAVSDIPKDLEELVRCAASQRVVVTGGFQPGQSTNAVAALAAEAVQADIFVNATSVDGVYTSDPRKDPAAKKLDEVTPDEMARILSGEGFGAGEYALMDPLAVRIIKRSRIPVTITNGREPSNIDKALRGKRVGTRIVPLRR
jgi:uridylate kinase